MNSTPDLSRHEALVKLGAAVGSFPKHLPSIQEAMKHVEQVGGRELAIEVGCTIAAFEAATRVADATIRMAPPSGIMKFMRVLNLTVLNSTKIMTVVIVGCLGLVGLLMVMNGTILGFSSSTDA